METILPHLFICVYIAIIATILPVLLWCMDSAPALKCNGNVLESWVAGHLDKEAQCENVWGSVQCVEVHTGGANFFNY